MKEIKCPKCNTTFKIDEQDYESILKQIKNHEFEKELREKCDVIENPREIISLLEGLKIDK